jgi:hypothetical protein
MDDWTTRALSGIEEGSPAHVQALVSRAFWAFADDHESAARAMQIADELGDASLQSAARDSRGVASLRAGDFEAAYELESSRFELRDKLGDPDLVHDLYLSTIPTAAAVAQLDEARRLAHSSSKSSQT